MASRRRRDRRREPGRVSSVLGDRTVVIVSGPGGVGKGTIVEALTRRDGLLWLSKSWTTRPRRPGELADAYRFVDRRTFQEAIRSGRFLEWVDFLDYRLGTPVPDPPDGCDVLLEIDVRGARRVRELVGDVVLVFVDAPDRDEQRTRMVRRGDPETAIRARLARAGSERSAATEMGYTVVVNDDLERAVAAVEGLIAADRVRRLGSKPSSP